MLDFFSSFFPIIFEIFSSFSKKKKKKKEKFLEEIGERKRAL